MMKRILVICLALCLIASLAACSKADFSNDFTELTGIRRGMTKADIEEYEASTFGSELESMSSNTLGEMVLHFSDSHHLDCLDPETEELQYANLSKADGDSVPELDEVLEALSDVKGDKESSDSYEFEQWYGTIDGAKCDIMYYKTTGNDSETTVSFSFGDYDEDYVWSYYE